MFKVKSKGDYSKATRYFKEKSKPIKVKKLLKYAEQGVEALYFSTPVDTGKTRESWYYKIIEDDGVIKIQYCNSNINNYIPIAIILQYGHYTGNGAWVEGIDYINPALRSVFDRIVQEAWKEVVEFK